MGGYTTTAVANVEAILLASLAERVLPGPAPAPLRCLVRRGPLEMAQAAMELTGRAAARRTRTRGTRRGRRELCGRRGGRTGRPHATRSRCVQLVREGGTRRVQLVRPQATRSRRWLPRRRPRRTPWRTAATHAPTSARFGPAAGAIPLRTARTARASRTKMAQMAMVSAAQTSVSRSRARAWGSAGGRGRADKSTTRSRYFTRHSSRQGPRRGRGGSRENRYV